MGYRNDNDALRAKVEKLEDELAVLKGRKLAERGTHEFDAKVKRQTILIVVAAILGTTGAGFCLVPMTIAALFSTEEVSADQIAAPTWQGAHSRSVELRAALDPSDILREDWGTDPAERYAYSPEGYLIPLAGHPTVVLYCRRDAYRTTNSDCDFATDAGRALDGDEDARRRLARTHDITASVYDIDAGGYGFFELEHADLVGYAEGRGFSPDELRILRVERARDGEVGVIIGMAIVFGGFALLLWLAFFAHRALARRAVELPTPADLMNRDPVMIIVFSVLTCGLYELYWQYATTLQLRRLTGRPDLQPGLDLLLNIVTLRFWTYWVAYRNAEAIDDAMSDMGVHTTHRNTALLMGLLSWTCGLLYWAMLYKQQEACNQLFLERLARDDFDVPESEDAPSSEGPSEEPSEEPQNT